MLLRSLPILFLLFVSSCASGPGVIIRVCVSDPGNGGFDCYDEESRENFFVKFSDSDRYVAFAPDDAKLLIESCKEND